MNQNQSLHTILALALLASLSSCASTSQVKHDAAARPSPGTQHVAAARPSPGAQIGKGTVHGIRYLIGVPFCLGVTVLAPLGGGSPGAGLQMLQELHDYELPE